MIILEFYDNLINFILSYNLGYCFILLFFFFLASLIFIKLFYNIFGPFYYEHSVFDDNNYDDSEDVDSEVD